MAADFKVITGANLFCDEDPGESNHIQLDEVAVPDLTRVMEEHSPGGGFMSLEIDMNMLEALTLPFTLRGINEKMLARVGYGGGQNHNYTVFKEVRDVRLGTKARLTCVVKGIMGSATQDAYNKRGLSGFNYEIRGISSYFLQLGDEVIYDLDFFAGRRIIRGIDHNLETNAILGIV